MAIAQAVCNTFKRDLLKGFHDFASGGSTFKIALFTSSASLGATTEDYSTSNETGLSATNTTSWVSNNAPQVLLYACLVEAFKFLKGPYDLLAQYEKSYQEATQRLAIEQQGRRRRDEYQDGVIRLPLPSQNP